MRELPNLYRINQVKKGLRWLSELDLNSTRARIEIGVNLLEKELQRIANNNQKISSFELQKLNDAMEIAQEFLTAISEITLERQTEIGGRMEIGSEDFLPDIHIQGLFRATKSAVK